MCRNFFLEKIEKIAEENKNLQKTISDIKAENEIMVHVK
jgi:hypothetical protein